MSKILIKWDKSYSLGIDLIDKQHKKLTDIINKLFSSFSEGKAEELIPTVINELTEYTIYHFKTEEELFDKYNYPGKENHVSGHNSFIEQVNNWKIKLKNNDENVHYECISYLKSWLIEHIQGSDVSYSNFFKENNIKI
ncbi:MAG: bacteriohemerythrin [Bacteroidales bacterium]|nr:bacteriohemerythrin [Bacteroidales bacterium]